MEYKNNEKQEWEDRIEKNERYKSVGKKSLPNIVNKKRKEEIYSVLDDIIGEVSVNIEDATVLDIGCGTGIYSEYYNEKGADVVGSDISSSAVKLSRKFVPNGDFLQAESSCQPLPDNLFDISHIFSVCYHIVNDKKWEETLSELIRLTKSGGYLVMRIEWVEKKDRRAEHVKYRSRESYKKILIEKFGCELSGVYEFSDVLRFRKFFVGLNYFAPHQISEYISSLVVSEQFFRTNTQQKVVIFKLP